MSQRAWESSSITDQLVIAAERKPRRFRTKWQQAINAGPTARKDAESAERDRWLSLPADLLRNTDTSMGRLHRENLASSQLLGGGRRAGTLSSFTSADEPNMSWLARSCSQHHGSNTLMEYLQVRFSEPCVRGSLKLVHSSFVFLHEVAGVRDRLTDAALCDVSKKDLLASALPGKPPRQAPQYPTILLAAFEDNVVSGNADLLEGFILLAIASILGDAQTASRGQGV